MFSSCPFRPRSRQFVFVTVQCLFLLFCHVHMSSWVYQRCISRWECRHELLHPRRRDSIYQTSKPASKAGPWPPEGFSGCCFSSDRKTWGQVDALQTPRTPRSTWKRIRDRETCILERASERPRSAPGVFIRSSRTNGAPPAEPPKGGAETEGFDLQWLLLDATCWHTVGPVKTGRLNDRSSEYGSFPTRRLLFRHLLKGSGWHSRHVRRGKGNG